MQEQILVFVLLCSAWLWLGFEWGRSGGDTKRGRLRIAAIVVFTGGVVSNALIFDEVGIPERLLKVLILFSCGVIGSLIAKRKGGSDIES